ncbi:TPA: SRPBCC family protein [Klebsiella michiganensis]|nr:SRPBCC family protein [Klebsiella michiganensis]
MREHIIVSDILDASVEDVWNKLSAFDRFADFHPGAVKSFYLHRTTDQQGSIRRVEMSDGYVEELLVNIDPVNYYIEYVILNSSLPLEGYRAEIKLYPVTQSNKSLIQWQAEFTTTHPAPEIFVYEVRNNVFIAGIAGLNDLLNKSGK